MYAKDLPLASVANGTEKMIGVQGDELKLYNVSLFKGAAGKDGINGLPGDNGIGVPTGGTVGQVLTKVDSTDYNVTWSDPTGATGGVVQTVYVDEGTNSSSVVNIPLDNTKPQITEGTQVLSLSIVPTSATNIISVTANISGSADAATRFIVALFKDGATNAVASNVCYVGGGNWEINVPLKYRVVSGGTSATTFAVRYGASSGTAYVNGDPTGEFDGTWRSWMEIQELAV